MLVLTPMASESPKTWLAVRGTSATPRSQACDEVMSFSRKRRNSDRGCMGREHLSTRKGGIGPLHVQSAVAMRPVAVVT